MTTSVRENSPEQFVVNRRRAPGRSAYVARLAVAAWLLIAFGGTRATSAGDRFAGLAGGQQKVDLPSRPNIVFLYTDDQAQWAMGAYGSLASVSSVDRNAGRLLAKIDELGLTSRTVVIFTSDHGYMIGEHGLFGTARAPVPARSTLKARR